MTVPNDYVLYGLTHGKLADASKLDAVLLKIQLWESKQRRAENALKKLYKKRKYYERKIKPCNT